MLNKDDIYQEGKKVIQMGPPQKWVYENRPVNFPYFETYLSLNTDKLEAQPFHMLEVEDGVGIEGGYEFEAGLPILAKLEVNNEWQGLEAF